MTPLLASASTRRGQFRRVHLAPPRHQLAVGARRRRESFGVVPLDGGHPVDARRRRARQEEAVATAARGLVGDNRRDAHVEKGIRVCLVVDRREDIVQPGHDELTGRVDHLCVARDRRRAPRADRRDAAILDDDDAVPDVGGAAAEGGHIHHRTADERDGMCAVFLNGANDDGTEHERHNAHRRTVPASRLRRAALV